MPPPQPVSAKASPSSEAQAINPQDLAVYDNRFVLDYHRLTADRRLIFGRPLPVARNLVRRPLSS